MTPTSTGVAPSRSPPELVLVCHPGGEVVVGAGPEAKHFERHLAAPPSTRRTDPAAGPRALQPQVGAAADAELRVSQRHWQALYCCQQALLALVLTLDVCYLVSLLVARKIYTDEDSILEGTAAFFLSSTPQNVSVAFTLAAVVSDTLGLLGAWYELPELLTVVVFWSAVLTIFSISRVPTFFLIMRGVGIVAAVELRLSMGRVLLLMPPVSLLSMPARLVLRGGAALVAAARRRFPRQPRAAGPAAAAAGNQAPAGGDVEQGGGRAEPP